MIRKNWSSTTKMIWMLLEESPKTMSGLCYRIGASQDSIRVNLYHLIKRNQVKKVDNRYYLIQSILYIFVFIMMWADVRKNF